MIGRSLWGNHWPSQWFSIYKNPLSGKPERGRLLPLALASSFCFLLAFHAGLLIMLALASLCQNTCASTLTFEPLQSAFQGFVFADAYLGHCYPSPRSSRHSLFVQNLSKAYSDHRDIIARIVRAVNHEFSHFTNSRTARTPSPVTENRPRRPRTAVGTCRPARFCKDRRRCARCAPFCQARARPGW